MRADLEIIQEWIPAGSRVLDLGCGDGELLTWLRDNKQVTGYGLENDADNIAECVAKGINVIEQDLDKGLGNFASNGFDVVVMTQACDLEYEKVSNVVLCAHVSLAEHREMWAEEIKGKGHNPTDRAWRRYCEDIRDGYVWNLTILNAGSGESLTTEHRIVDFHEIYTVPRDFLEILLSQRQELRLRLLST